MLPVKWRFQALLMFEAKYVSDYVGWKIHKNCVVIGSQIDKGTP